MFEITVTLAHGEKVKEYTLPLDINEVSNDLGIDFDLVDPEPISLLVDYENIPRCLIARPFFGWDDLNHIAEVVDNLPDWITPDIFEELLEHTTLSDIEQNAEYWEFYEGLESMGDFAREVVFDSVDIDTLLEPYIDWESMGEDVALEGNFIVLNEGIVLAI